jgi:hypothetical protein
LLKTRENFTATDDVIKIAVGEDSMSRAQVFEWFLHFKEGRIEMLREVGISVGLFHAIVTEHLGMRPVAAKFVPRVLTAEKKENHLFASTDFFVQNQMKLCRKYHCSRNMNIRLRSRNKGPVIGSENPFVPTAEESSPRSKQDKSVSHRFSYIKMALCVMSSLRQVKQEIRNIIDNICVSSAKLYAASDQKSGRQWNDQSTTTTRQRTQFVQHFSATDKIDKCSILHILLASQLVTSFNFPK